MLRSRITSSPAAGGHGLATAVLATAMLSMLSLDASAEPNRHVLRQVTNITVGETWAPKIRSQDGDSIAFVSTGDVLGPGTGTVARQIYYWSEATNTITQVTNGIDCESYDAARPMDGVFSGGRPEVIAFISECDLDPSRGNGDGNPEVFLWEIESGTFHQLTDTQPPVSNATPYLSDSGRCLVFSSDGDLDDNVPSNEFYDSNHPGPGFSNIDGSREIFMYSKISAEEGIGEFPYNATFTQVSNGPAGTVSEKPVIGGYWFARQCQTTAWQSDHDQLGTGRAGTHIWMYRRPASAVEEMIAAEIPNGFPDGTYTNPFISSASPFARGPHITFEGAPDLWNNGSLGIDIFNYRVFHPRLTQFTNTGLFSDPFVAETLKPSVSDGGGVYSYYSSGEHVSQKREARIGGLPPFNADGNYEIFRLKGRRRIYQLTRTENCSNVDPALDDAGRRFTWLSNCDLIPGQNPNGLDQVFIWSLEKKKSPLTTPDGCVQSQGCCNWAKRETGCYEPVFGTKPKPPRPNCVERDRCD